MVVPYGDRSNSIIEPLLTEQWFVDAKFLAKKSNRGCQKEEDKFFSKSLVKKLISNG